MRSLLLRHISQRTERAVVSRPGPKHAGLEVAGSVLNFLVCFLLHRLRCGTLISLFGSGSATAKAKNAIMSIIVASKTVAILSL